MDVPIFLLLAAAIMSGLAKGGLGGQIPVAMIVPLLSFFMPVSQAVAICLPLLVFADFFAIKFYWGDWDSAQIRHLIPMGLVGVFLGAIMLSILPDGILRPILGTFTLIAVIYKYASETITSLSYKPRQWHWYVIGWAAGFASTLANQGGPILVSYLLLRKAPPIPFIGTVTLFFFVINLFKFPGYFSTGTLTLDAVVSVLWVLPVIPAGVWLGRKATELINQKAFETTISILLVLMSLFLIFGARPN